MNMKKYFNFWKKEKNIFNSFRQNSTEKVKDL